MDPRCSVHHSKKNGFDIYLRQAGEKYWYKHHFICHCISVVVLVVLLIIQQFSFKIYLRQAGEKYWHEHHFICCDCGVRIRGDSKVRKIYLTIGRNSLINTSYVSLRSEENAQSALSSPPHQVWQKEGRLYCDADYKKKFVPRCADCSGFILGVIYD